ncbi:SAM-dependent methyltransferase [Micromonospora coxensis]|uniref:SAM-dependent methyltransferase, MidA family n=1 Tax=Micromonospora coxensis TaxID=356852 RepID=A0A1C5IK20_9ACTN|nr:SAM-dependent methyltransferase [Micromonospora coxensis]SCG58359.1 SAM-dependent methyltransferase, MidA family [Micromonospora coxensis]
MSMRWRDAMDRALYGPGGFFVAGSGPAAHFRTSVHASPVLASALHRLLTRVDATLDHPARLDLVDVGAGRGELLVALLRAVRAPASPPAGPGSAPPVPLADRVRLVAVEKAPRPDDLPEPIGWTDEIPAGIVGLLVATEWLDNVPLDVAVPTPDGWRYLLVDPATGAETVGDPVEPADRAWLDRWWPVPADGTGAPGATGPGLRAAAGPSPTTRSRPAPPPTVHGRAEIGRTRDEAWAAAVGRIDRGLALAVDYGHLRDQRPVGGTLTGYRGGRQVPPVPDGSCDVTAHVALDSVASAGARVARCAYSLGSQREALRALGADGGRPPLGLASVDPAGYVRALAAASAVAELTDPAGLGGHHWLRQPVGVAADPLMAR